jgi:multiple sugar transport system permease protein
VFNGIINPLQVVLALLLALLVLPDDRLTRGFRIALVLPMSVSTALTAVLFGLFLDRNIGPLNAVLDAVGLGRQAFYRDPSQALWTLIGVATWKGAGYWMIFMLAGLKGVPADVLEAAAIDGAGRWSRFRHVVLPLMRRPIAFVLVADTAINFLFFAPVYILTSGGPANQTRLLMFEAFQSAFTYNDPGRSLAISTVLLGLLAVIVTAQLALFRSKEG